ncbi:protease modulator HflC [Arenicella xantha]|uniref:Protein HflC n=1 Tax=Arenicella xantha TaxID=644221 RepID=A0A395JKC1_9GAMM|nr:protease modulator HflC [Arenicella xantha]RBP49342.1 protease FtsH subunit HflC [Arenicella xantha]
MKSENLFMGIAIVIALAVVVFSSSLFTVNQWERALKFQFGEFSGEEIQPGINFKIPFVNTIEKYDIRIQTMDRPPERFITVDKEELLVDSFVKWRINDLQKYFKTVKFRANAENRLEQKINNSLKAQIARRNINDVVAGDRGEIMSVVQQAIDSEAAAIGVEVVDVRLKRVDLADQIQANVFERMRSERERIANEYRATGNEAAIEIRANADRTKVELVSEAEKKAQLTRGDADASATKIYADAFGADVEFYDFFRSLNAYKATFNSSGDLIILDPESDFFKHFNSATR